MIKRLGKCVYDVCVCVDSSLLLVLWRGLHRSVLSFSLMDTATENDSNGHHSNLCVCVWT